MKTLEELRSQAVRIFNEYKEDALKAVRNIHSDAETIEIPICMGMNGHIIYFRYDIKTDRFVSISFEYKGKMINIELGPDNKIQSIKDSWNREEMIELCYFAFTAGTLNKSFSSWVKSNL